jgi:hypothetical protein
MPLPSASSFVECFLSGTRQRDLCREPHSTKRSLPRAAFGKVPHSVTRSFTEYRTLGTETHSAKKSLPSAELSAKSRQRPSKAGGR